MIHNGAERCKLIMTTAVSKLYKLGRNMVMSRQQSCLCSIVMKNVPVDKTLHYAAMVMNKRTNPGFPTRMVYLDYISLYRYTILVRNPWNITLQHNLPAYWNNFQYFFFLEIVKLTWFSFVYLPICLCKSHAGNIVFPFFCHYYTFHLEPS